MVVWQVAGLAPAQRVVEQTLYTWISSGDFVLDLTFRVDPLSSVMILVITGIGSLIHIYSTAYMHDERDSEFARYFSYLNLFAAFMLVLVLGANFLVMFVGWEGVGLCSYLLIGFWFEKKSAVRRRQEGVRRQPHRRLRVHPRHAAALRALRDARFPAHRLGRRAAGAGDRCSARSRSRRCCCSSARPASRRRFRSTSGCPTRWKARRRSPR